MVRSEAEVRMALGRVMGDERIAYPPASVEVNAPLALIQVGLKTKRDVLQWVLWELDRRP